MTTLISLAIISHLHIQKYAKTAPLKKVRTLMPIDFSNINKNLKNIFFTH